MSISAVWVNDARNGVAYRQDDGNLVTICMPWADGSTIAFQASLSGLDDTWTPLTGNQGEHLSDLSDVDDLPTPPDGSPESLAEPVQTTTLPGEWALDPANTTETQRDYVHPADFQAGTIVPPSTDPEPHS